ncbi:MAG: small ribosomal subunit Rsm22 family protein [Spirochaetes bacterium]|nr:small ribosomal subunit Rsm22 family protein [Spirochaetota bacterium]
MFLFPYLQKQQRQALNKVPVLIEKTFPLPGRFRSSLAFDIKELSRLLTSARGERSLSYLSRPNLLSAYLRYFLPWNIYRLCRLLGGIELSLKAGDTVIDLGCGPFTMAAALWIAKPELRGLPLEFRCVDSCAPALEAGKKFFAALCSEDGGAGSWKIKTVKSGIENYSAGGQGAALVCAVNVFNEVQGKTPHFDAAGQKRKAANAARILCGLAAPGASILAVEPGIPNSGQFVSLLREELLARDFLPASPCPHEQACPMPGGFSQSGEKTRWCHFAFDTADAPKALHGLSAMARLPKERAVLSFLLAKAPGGVRGEVGARVVSDSFPLGDGLHGRYACSSWGLLLLKGEKHKTDRIPAGAFVPLNPSAKGQRDAKSGALAIRL